MHGTMNIKFLYYAPSSVLQLDTGAIQGVTGGMCETSGECSLGQTIPIYPKTPISKVERLRS